MMEGCTHETESTEKSRHCAAIEFAGHSGSSAHQCPNRSTFCQLGQVEERRFVGAVRSVGQSDRRDLRAGKGVDEGKICNGTSLKLQRQQRRIAYNSLPMEMTTDYPSTINGPPPNDAFTEGGCGKLVAQPPTSTSCSNSTV
jgi:hypothetical protein